MRNNKIFKCIMKYMPLYVAMLFVMFIQRYFASLTGLFIGEVLGSLNGDKSVLPSVVARYVNNGSFKAKIISLSIIYIVVTSLSVLASFIMRTLRVIHYQKLYISLSEAFYEHVIDIPRSEYANRSTGDIIQRNIEDCRRIPQLFRNSLYELFKIVFTIGTLLMQLYLLNKTIFSVS